TSWARTRSFFPVTRDWIYLDHAGVAPISTRVEEALRRYADLASCDGATDYAAYEAEVARVRSRAALLIGAAPEEIAFVKNTTEGLGIVACGLDWRRGDIVLTCDLEYPSNVTPWWGLRARGVETVILPSQDGRLPIERVEGALGNPRVRLLALSSVEFGNGARNDLEMLGRLCRDRGVLFCVDAIQSLGCLCLDVERANIDFLAADGHKWLLSVEGCGIFFCARRMLEKLAPRIVGWHNVAEPTHFDRYQTELRRDAQRFEEGTRNTAGIFALGAAIDLLLELELQAVEKRVLMLTEHLAEGLRARGATLLSPRGDAASGIVSFRMGDIPPARSIERLRARHIHCVARRGGVRASPHFYIDTAEIDALLESL
ncbi:MAG: aminotransferase class V-fold PLP-dependent enzyme, partial [Myxococcales bacterium]|nr:aminotransferase class V-fold PLP-dependent enzyme [Myxococcales bacterium]